MEQFQQIVGSLWFQMSFMIIFATVHGYAAAWLAVRMLFRPRRAVKFLGITVFPQGMIPRHRDRLAEAIGKAVGNELMSHDTIVNALFEKDFLRGKIETLVNSYSDEYLSKSYPSLLEALPASARAPVLDGITTLQNRLGEYILQTLRSEETAQGVSEFVSRRVDDFLSKKISEVADEETFGKILGFLETRIKGVLQERALENQIRDFIGGRLDDLTQTTVPLGEMLTEDAVHLVKERLREQVQPIVHQIAEIAVQDRTRKQISSLIKGEINDYYQHLPFYQKFFVSRDKLFNEVDDLVNTTLPRKIEETLKGETFAAEAEAFLFGSIDNLLQKPLPEIIGQIAPDKLETLKTQITSKIVLLLKSEHVSNSISVYLFDTLHNLRPHTLGAILKRTHTDIEPRLKNVLTKTLVNILHHQETENTVRAVIASQVERLLVTPIGNLTERIGADSIQRAGVVLTDRIITAAQERLPVAIKDFDITGLVKEKVNNYPVEKLEQLVLSVAGQHLRKIELFGLFIGFFLGAAQALFVYWSGSMR
jgi:uncharacterized membrane protein YheB (UPF0754 family)